MNAMKPAVRQGFEIIMMVPSVMYSDSPNVAGAGAKAKAFIRSQKGEPPVAFIHSILEIDDIPEKGVVL